MADSSLSIDQILAEALQCEFGGDVAGALRQTRKALQLAQKHAVPSEVARAKVAVARYRFRLAQYAAARQLAREALVLCNLEDESHLAIYANALMVLGMCAAENGALEECEETYRQVIDLAREIGDWLLYQRALHNLASAVYLWRGQFDLAIKMDEEALRLAQEHGPVEWQQFPLITLSMAYQESGQRARAEQALAELRRVAQPNSAGMGYADQVEALLALDEGQLERAQICFSRALTIAEKMGDPSMNLSLRLVMSRYYRLMYDGANALMWANEACQMAERWDYPRYASRARLECARAHWLLGDLPAAEAGFRRCINEFTPHQLLYDATTAQLLLAALLLQREDPEAGLWFDRAVQTVLRGGFGFLFQHERAYIFPLVARYLNDADPERARASLALLEQFRQVLPPPLEVHVLGEAQVYCGGIKLERKDLRQRRAGELLALLALTPGHTLRNEEAAEALCPDKDGNGAMVVFQHACSALRRLLEPELADRRFPSRYLEVSEGMVTLRLPPGSWIDALAFQESCQASDWQAAVDLYTGDLLPDYRDAQWAAPHRENYLDQLAQACLALAEQCLTQGQPDEAARLTRRVIALDPWHERAVELGMRAALALGERAAAMRLYRQLEKVLKNELGISPQASVRQLYESIPRHRSA